MLNKQNGIIKTAFSAAFLFALLFFSPTNYIGATSALEQHQPALDPSGELVPLAPIPKHGKIIQEVQQKLNQFHYRQLALNDQLSQQLFNRYWERLDLQRLFMLHKDIQHFAAYRTKLDDAIVNGNLLPVYEMYNRFRQRSIEILEWQISKLDKQLQSFDFTRDEQMRLDRKEAAWAPNRKTLDNLWRKRLKHQMLELKINDSDADNIQSVMRKRLTDQLSYVKRIKSEDVFDIFVNAYTSLYDPHTNYFSPINSENFYIGMRLSLEGIGAQLLQDGDYTKVYRIITAGPADKEGTLQAADRIIGVGQGADGEIVDIIGWQVSDVVQLIRGKKNTTVRLKIIAAQNNPDDKHSLISIIRDEVKLEEQAASTQVVPIEHNGNTLRIGVIDIPTFYTDFEAMYRGEKNYRSTTRDVRRLLDELTTENTIDGLIIDLRNNSGGSLDEANALVGLFIRSGPTVQIRNRNNRFIRRGKKRRSNYHKGPLAVVVNRLSASASEIFAAAIQDHQRGLILGSQTFGKGTVQTLVNLSHGQLKLTESKFYRISGKSTQLKGVTPDILFPMAHDPTVIGESALSNALLWDQVDQVRYYKYHPIPQKIDSLITQHKDRLPSNPDFVFQEAQLAFNERNKIKDFISLNEDVRKKRSDYLKSERRRLDNQRRVAKGLPPQDEDDSASDKAKASTDTVVVNDKGHAVSDPLPQLADEVKPEEEDIFDVEKDPFLYESASILVDAMPIFDSRPQLSVRKYDQ